MSFLSITITEVIYGTTLLSIYGILYRYTINLAFYFKDNFVSIVIHNKHEQHHYQKKHFVYVLVNILNGKIGKTLGEYIKIRLSNKRGKSSRRHTILLCLLLSNILSGKISQLLSI